jgi:hypothetical protein
MKQTKKEKKVCKRQTGGTAKLPINSRELMKKTKTKKV